MGMFDDMMSSSRGPGVIGTMMALIVIIGFGTLYFFVFDEGMRGADKSIETIIKEDGKEIESLQREIAAHQKTLTGGPELTRISAELAKITSDTRMNFGKVEGQTNLVTTIQKEIADGETEFAKYKQAYREQMREKGKGATYPELKVGSATYVNAVVKNVDATGILFSHSTGSKRVNFTDLTPELQEYFQYDADEASSLEDSKRVAEADHARKVEAANNAADAAQRAEDVKRREIAVREAKAEIAAQTRKIKDLDTRISQLQSQMAADRQAKKFVNRSKFENMISAAQNEKMVARDRLENAKRILGN